ncbi:MAG: FAD-dependent oxidoreductase, partial [Deltaproteobacteria bacterium]|nr:FAD-dependent oxidoreductase [Deltaproteobacteria bacterium]
ETSLWPNRAPVGKVLLRVMLGGSREPGVLDLDDEQLVARSHRAVSGTLSISGGPEAHNLVRWPRAIPQYSLGHRGRVERAESELEDQRIVLAGNAYRGVSVNDCIAGGRRVARRVAALIAAGALMLLTACSSTAQRPSHPGDAGASAERTGTPEPASEQAAGDVVVEVLWKQPPAALVRSRGANACRGERRPWLSVHAAGGVRNAVVVLDGQAATTEAAVLRLGDCRAWPAMVALASGHDLDVVNADRRSADVALIGPAGEKRGLPMRVLGQRVRVPDLEGGLWTVNIGADRGVGYVHAATSEQRSTVTDGRGRARFSGVKPGKHRARVIHPPVKPGGAPLAAEAVVEVVANETSKISVSLGK